MFRNIPKILFFIALTCAMACGGDINFQDKDTSPEIAFDTMTDIICDMQIAEAVAKDKILKRDSFPILPVEDYYSTILTIHEASQASFETTMDYYLQHPVEMEILFDSVENKLRRYSKSKPVNQSPNSTKDFTPKPDIKKKRKSAN